MKRLSAIAVIIGVGLAHQAEAQNYDTNNVVVQTFAGSGFSGYVDGVGQQTMFNDPTAIVADPAGNLFVVDNSRIRKIVADGTVSTFVGGGDQTTGLGTNVYLGDALGPMIIDHDNTLWMVRRNSSSLERIGMDSYASLVPLHSSFVNGNPASICVDSMNNIYMTDQLGNKIYRYRTNGVLETFVGSGNVGAEDGNGLFCSFFFPAALAADAADNIYVWDFGNNIIRKINQNKDVVTIAGTKGVGADSDGIGTNATFANIFAIWPDSSGDLILACGSSIRRMTAATNVTTIAGNFGRTGYTNGAGNVALFNNTRGVCVSHGMIFVSDSSNQRIRSIAFNPSYQWLAPANLKLSTYPGLQITGIVGRTYQVQASPDMNQWNNVATLLLTSSPYLWIDQNPVSGNRFYRAFLQP